jgi:hypothetical protein
LLKVASNTISLTLALYLAMNISSFSFYIPNQPYCVYLLVTHQNFIKILNESF